MIFPIVLNKHCFLLSHIASHQLNLLLSYIEKLNGMIRFTLWEHIQSSHGICCEIGCWFKRLQSPIFNTNLTNTIKHNIHIIHIVILAKSTFYISQIHSKPHILMKILQTYRVVLFHIWNSWYVANSFVYIVVLILCHYGYTKEKARIKFTP